MATAWSSWSTFIFLGTASLFLGLLGPLEQYVAHSLICGIWTFHSIDDLPLGWDNKHHL